MNPGYIQTWREHRALFLFPVILAGAVALWLNLAAPKVYRSSTSLWSDIAGGSANQAIGAPAPAVQEQSTLNELLRTQFFRNTVARKSGLSDYLEQHPTDGWGPKALVRKLSGPLALNDRIAGALSAKKVVSTVEGPHVLKVSFDGPTPALALKTLTSLVAEFRKERNALSQDALSLYQKQVDEASQALAAARGNLSAYLRDHPDSSTDPRATQLSHAERQAVLQLADATDTLNQASSSALNPASVQTVLRIVDPAEIPTAAAGSHKKMLVGLIGGLFVGAVISMLGIVAMTRYRGRVREAEVVTRGPQSRAGEVREMERQETVLRPDGLSERRTRSG
jgi:uncharacterized protein involved in exopolysaccharide biosynthesis